MGWIQSFAISQSGMDAERMRVEVAALNIANANIAATPGRAAVKPLRVITQPSPVSFSQIYQQEMTDSRLRGVATFIVEQPAAAPRRVHEPSNPLADERGFVEYPGINSLDEMLTLTTAVRAYEANVVSFNAAKAMAVRALDIGGQS